MLRKGACSLIQSHLLEFRPKILPPPLLATTQTIGKNLAVKGSVFEKQHILLISEGPISAE